MVILRRGVRIIRIGRRIFLMTEIHTIQNNAGDSGGNALQVRECFLHKLFRSVAALDHEHHGLDVRSEQTTVCHVQ